MIALLARFSARPQLAVLILGLVLLSCGNWLLPLVDRDEPRFAEATREMRQRNDFLIPHFNGQYRFDKPPLIYCCQAAFFRSFGETPLAALAFRAVCYGHRWFAGGVVETPRPA